MDAKKWIEVDKIYRMRNGCITRVICTDGATTCHPIVSQIISGTCTGKIVEHTKDGRCSVQFDLIKKCERPEDEPEQPELKVDWDALPAWANWVCCSDDGKWTWHKDEPMEFETFRLSRGRISGTIPATHLPKNFDGDWKNSLTKRPEDEPDGC